MKRAVLVGYVMLASVTILLQSCEDGPIVPNSVNNTIDTTWIEDSTYNGGGNGNPIDSTNWGGGNPIDSTSCGGGNPIDSTNWGGGNGNPGDTL